jgi:hypothetical protein
MRPKRSKVLYAPVGRGNPGGRVSFFGENPPGSRGNCEEAGDLRLSARRRTARAPDKYQKPQKRKRTPGSPSLESFS